jgi:hypothetical protein
MIMPCSHKTRRNFSLPDCGVVYLLKSRTGNYFSDLKPSKNEGNNKNALSGAFFLCLFSQNRTDKPQLTGALD